MRLSDARRLTGRNVWTTGAAAAAEIGLDDGDDPDAIIAALRQEVADLFPKLGFGSAPVVARVHRRGISVAVPVDIDALYASVSALEHALGRVAAGQGRVSVAAGADVIEQPAAAASDDERALREIVRELARERKPRLMALLAAARERDVPALWDDDELSLGLGERSRTFAVGDLPAPEDVTWSDLGRVPVALVTGTNGKTTTTRMLARMIGAAGLCAGHTSTDGMVVGGNVLDGGDWSGPGGARKLLRHRSVQAAVLETARGGLLRRGLALEGCDVGLVTNIGDDHFGEYGVHDLAAMSDVKLLVGQGLREGGALVLNGDDEPLLARAQTLRDRSGAARQVLFSTRPDGSVVSAHVANGGVAWSLEDGWLVRVTSGERRRLLPIVEIPLTYRGAAAHNVENALAAAAVGDALGLPWDALASGLRSLLPTPRESPGRSNVLSKDGVRLLLDFAHNPAGVAVTLSFVAALRAADVERGRLFVIVGQAGDRSDEEIQAFARGVHQGGADVVIARDLQGYLRGRAPGATPGVFREELVRLGLPEASVLVAHDDVEALTMALEGARRGDTVALLVQVDSDGVHQLLQERGWSLDEPSA